MNRTLSIGVAEDEPDVREFYQIVIPELGHKLLWTARDGIELIQKCEQACPDLLIVDVKMPRLDGIDAVRSFAFTSRTPVPVILVTGYHDDETIQRAKVAQVICYLIKPIRESDLRAGLAIALRQHESLELLRDGNQRVKTIRAANLISEISGMSEQQAFRRLDQLADQEHRDVSAVADTILAAGEPPETDCAPLVSCTNGPSHVVGLKNESPH